MQENIVGSNSSYDKQTALQLEAIDHEARLEEPWYERILNIAATPFSYETGFYF